MGICCSVDSLPPVPKALKSDPDVRSTVDVVTKKFGMFGRDYGIWDKECPKSTDDQKDTIWLWFNKGSVGNQATIDLENFVRGTKQDNPDKGKVLYTIIFQNSPFFTQFQRIPSSTTLNFIGIFNDVNYQDDQYYLNHPTHTAKRISGSMSEGSGIITKFQLNTHATIRDGDCGRGSDLFGKDDIVLEVFSTGTAVTTYCYTMEEVHDRNEEGNITGTRHEKRNHKIETEFVDRVEFRLSFKGQLMGSWFIMGDSTIYGSNANVSFQSPLFDVTQEGGFFAPTLTRISTKPNIDPALAMLVAHTCFTEYSVASIKMKLTPNTPQSPPNLGYQYLPMTAMNYQSNFVQPHANAFVLAW